MTSSRHDLAATQLDLFPARDQSIDMHKHLLPAIATPVYDTYWHFAAERQAMFFRRLSGEAPPWSEDRILRNYRFTNAYRAIDRVSQYLISRVIYDRERDASDMLFRILLFKIFNRIETWQLLEDSFGDVSIDSFSLDRYDDVLTRAMQSGQRIYSAAYIMPSVRSSGHERKHRGHLGLLERIVNEDIVQQIVRVDTLQGLFELLRAVPSFGDFLAFQYAIDINYSPLTDFSESDFVVAGPGARDGIRKCFESTGGLSDVEIIRLVTDLQEFEFDRLGLQFQTLWGRRLQLIDCQNLFCEVGKYARVAHPEFTEPGGRLRIKQKYASHAGQLSVWFPPKWGINETMERG